MGLVAVVLLLGAGLLLWMALAVADFREPVADQGPVSAVDPSRPPTAEQPAPSGWAPLELAVPEGEVVEVAAPTAADLGAGLLAQVVATAPVVVTVDAATKPGLDVARGLARDLRAPLLVLDRPGVQDSGSTETPAAASPAPASPAPASPDPASPGGASPGAASPAAASADPTGSSDEVDDTTAATTDSVPSATDLLSSWATTHVVAVGIPPTTTAQVHQVTVEVPPPPSASPDGTPSPAPEPVVTRPEAVEAMRADAAAVPAPEPADDVTAVVRDELPQDLAAAVDLLGMETVAFTGDDPRSDVDLQEGLADAGTTVLAVADDQWPDLPATTVPPDWPSLVASAVGAPELVGGGKVLFPERTLVASYGNPRGPALGVLGERDLDGSIAYTKDLAADYEGLFGDSRVQPAFDLIATVASGDAEPDGSYSRKEDVDLLTEWVDGANEAGLYVILDLQPGREDFLTQAQRLEDLLRRPNVGLALDPEWRLAPDQVHLAQIGTVTTAEVNEVSDWLAELVRDEVLPQKLLIIHNFRESMMTDRQDLRFPAELATMIHVDGQGPQSIKDDTYEVLTNAGPDQLWWGWKNFFDEDSPEIRSPEDTAQIEPQPHVITYQ